MTALVRRESVDAICAHRARAVELYGSAVARLKEAMDAHERACQVGGRASLPSLVLDGNDRFGRPDEFLAKMTVRMDRDIWRGLIVGTPIGSLMDAQERKAFEQSLDQDPPPATAENVRTTLERLMGESDAIFRRGLVNAFRSLDRAYASNDGFKIGERIVLTWSVTWDTIMSYFTLHPSREDELQDVDRVMHVLDGKPAPEYQQGLCAALRGHCYSAGRDKGTTGETPYWRYRIFKNGNLHLWPLRRDLLDHANRIIAEHFGLVVPAGRDAREAAPDHRPPPGRTYAADYFPTPADLAARVIAEAGIEPGMLVLEPSAGDGALVAAASAAGGKLWAFEIDRARAGILAGRYFTQSGFGDLSCSDFLERAPRPAFDRVVMNPPFSKGQDVRHVLHALGFLKSGGRLVAIVSAGVAFRTDKLTAHLRAEIGRRGGTISALPPGSFKASGTTVNTCLIVVDAVADVRARAA